ncbi:kinesin-like protein KIF21B [Cyclospora cayetanensis]|uniref:Kinesin-like protein KIF21B n=1 Tax=Cyclospora cayetanensis TaxID=88456 RepID=A0A6P6RUD5_9EIME|nr:kinesin-like protein KIF21B [Cyclospora cayetanensis]
MTCDPTHQEEGSSASPVLFDPTNKTARVQEPNANSSSECSRTATDCAGSSTPSDPPRGHSHGEPPRAPQAASCASESTGTSLGEGGITSSSVSSLAGPPEGQGGAVSCRDPRRPPWARRGPTEAEWALKAEDAKGWVLAPPWILDMGAPRVSASDGGTSNEEVRQRVPARVWDGYKDVCYEADYVFGPEASNAEVYFHLVKRLVTAAVGGTNATVLAYGQTASGKTHTMFGSPQQGSPGGKGVPQRVPQTDKGIIQLALQDIFQEREQRGEEERFSVSLAMFEVYQEAVTDLLHGTAGRSPGGPSQAEAPSDLRQKRPIALCEKADGTLDMGSLTTRSVSSLAEALDLVKRGQQRRHAAETAANARSSRSHAVLRVVLAPAAATAIATAAGGTATVAEGTALKEESGRLLSRNPWRPSVLSMVDLAGSEGSGNTTSGGRLTNKTQREGGTINRSLLALSKVVKALTKQQQKQYQHPQKKEETAALPSGLSEEVPGSAGTGQRPPPQFLGLRESKLTRLLGDCLGGPCHTSLICLCAPGAVCYRQTAATLMFARRARKLPPVVQAGVQEGASKLKRHYIKASSSDAAPAPAALAAAPSGLGGSNNCPVEGVPGASSGGPPRPFVYVPTGCVQCRALYKAFQEAKEELACQAIQLRQLRYVINRGLPATAVAAGAAAAGYAFADSSSSNCDNGSSDSEADIERQHQEQQPEGRKRTDDEALEAWYATCSVAPSEGPIRLGSLGTTDCAPAAAVVGADKASRQQQQKGTSSNSSQVKVIYVCEVCEKDFRSAQQYEAHARSLKHKKNVKRLAAQLEADLEGLDAGYDELPKPQEAEQQDKEERHDKEEEGTSAVSAEDECEQSSGNQPQATKGPSATGASRISSSRSSSPVSSSSKGRSDLPHISSDESISSCDSGDSDDSCSSDESDSEEDADEALLRLAGSRTAQWGHSKGRRRDSTSSNCSRGELEEPGETVAAVATEESEDEQPDGVEAPKGGRKRHSRRQQLPGKAENNNSKSTSSPKGSRRKQATKVSADCSSSAEAGGATDSGKTTGSKEGIAKETTCAVCGTFFPTRNALFNHIKKEGHAALKPVPVGKGRKTK